MPDTSERPSRALPRAVLVAMILHTLISAGTHLAAKVATRQASAFDLVVMRSFAEALVDDLKVMARSHDLSVDFATR